MDMSSASIGLSFFSKKVAGAASCRSPTKKKTAKTGAATNETAPRRGTAAYLSFSYLSLLLLLYVALPSFILSVFLLLRIGSPATAYWISMVLLGGVIFYNRGKLRIGDYVVFFCILVLCHAPAYFTFDMCFDGLAYHQPAVRRLADGFNPIYDGYMNLERPPDIWSDQATYFPKAMWYFAATVTAAAAIGVGGGGFTVRRFVAAL